MDIHSILGIIFVVVLTVLLVLYRKRLDVQKILGPLLYFAMWRTKLGLKQMEWGKTWLRKPVRILGYAGVVIGFLGMILVTAEVITASIALLTTPEAVPSLQPVLPIQAKGVFFVPFVYWIISIFIIAVVHEFAHGIVARAHDIPIKSSGFAFLGVLIPIVPAAFVEPDEKNLPKKPVGAQLSLFAAGAFANILTALVLVFLFAIPLIPTAVTKYTTIYDIGASSKELVQLSGLEITKIQPDSPAEKAGLLPGHIVTAFDGINVTDTDTFVQTITNRTPGETVELTANGTTYSIVLAPDPKEPGHGIMGVNFDVKTSPNPAALERYGAFGVQARLFFINLIIWIFTLSLGIGVFNLIPIGPIDGGRMLHLVATRWLPKRGHFLWKWTSVILLGLIVANLAAGWIG